MGDGAGMRGRLSFVEVDLVAVYSYLSETIDRTKHHRLGVKSKSSWYFRSDRWDGWIVRTTAAIL
jgi:hypothetical protein